MTELLTVKDVAEMTGWCEEHIRRLCRRQVLPYIPGSPMKFFRQSLLEALSGMQTGGQYGRRKPKKYIIEKGK